MNYKYVLFDLDGTLIDTNQLIIDSFRYTYKLHLNKDVMETELFEYFGEPLTDTLRRQADSEETFRSMYNTYIEYNEGNHDLRVKLFEGIKECLENLKERGHMLAVVTSKRRAVAIRGLELFDILKYFSTIIAVEDTDLHKPYPEPILKALEQFGASEEEAIMIGDSIFDIRCAKAAKVKSVLVKWSRADGHQGNEDTADYIIGKVEDLLKIV